ncbi:MAG: type II toxin-antitoxin system RelE/ParE family toxin [Chlamydiia bacterium]|nr:type II toxin-antitoxin system RelE/ParE family toxin [Chlamydiia bacterium]
MIRSFADQETEDIFHGRRSKKALKRLSVSLWRIAYRKLTMLEAAGNLDDLKVPPSNHLEKLKGSLKGYCSIRINDQWRIIFLWEDKVATNVQIIDYH